LRELNKGRELSFPMSAGTGIRPRVLIVEDDAAVAAGIVAALDDTMDVETCTSAEAALARVGRERYEVVCADYGLPGITGLELLERLVGTERAPRGLLITGSEEFYRVSKRRGYYVIKKPFDPERLLTVVGHLASLAQMRQTVDQLQTGPKRK